MLISIASEIVILAGFPGKKLSLTITFNSSTLLTPYSETNVSQIVTGLLQKDQTELKKKD